MDLLLLIILLIGFTVVWLSLKNSKRREPDQALVLLQNQITELNRTLENKLGESSKVLREQFTESARIIKDITQELVKVGEGQKQVFSMTEQLKNLQDILKNPKQRGVLGEYYLETVLKNVLPPGSYQMQYPFKNGEIVDAVIFYQERIIPIDSKFSLENYNRILEAKSDDERRRLEDALRSDLKNRIDETSKYIRPSEGTIEFAFMFIPSEALYYDLLVNKVGSITARDLVEYAVSDKKVFIVSPTSLLAYLQTVIQGLRQSEINKSAEQIRKNIGELSRHLATYDSYMQKLGNHLGTTVGMYNKASKEFKKIDKDFVRITGKSMNVESTLLEAPELEEAETE
ncbi:DNA recombination protein RmuC [Candidatus Parcubacteria bacterium]|nr:MAG: DNA recombination protein RmuC [Candidatus Parcubacteria bacterium]